jgi:hypothetical protein
MKRKFLFYIVFLAVMMLGVYVNLNRANSKSNLENYLYLCNIDALADESGESGGYYADEITCHSSYQSCSLFSSCGHYWRCANPCYDVKAKSVSEHGKCHR